MIKYLILKVVKINISDVKLLPMFIPMTKPVACRRVSIPPPIKPMTITVVGPED